MDRTYSHREFFGNVSGVPIVLQRKDIPSWSRRRGTMKISTFRCFLCIILWAHSVTAFAVRSMNRVARPLFAQPDRETQRKNGDSKNNKGRFAQGKELKRLREDTEKLKENLKWATAMHDDDRIQELTQAIANGENRDPDVVYERALQQITKAKIETWKSYEEKHKTITNLEHEAQAARACLPRFHMHGLWVGNYGEQGEQIINVTYVGDTLIATKSTGDVNVPRGQVSFTVNLAPHNDTALNALKVSLDSSGAAQLPRFPGKGQIAKPGFVESKYVEGQMVLFENHFSFVWIPSRHHILFRRPKPEQTVELLRNIISKEDELENMRSHVSRCFDMDMTDSLARFHANEGPGPFRRIPLKEDLERTMNRSKGDHNLHGRLPFLNKWRNYFDEITKDESDNTAA